MEASAYFSKFIDLENLIEAITALIPKPHMFSIFKKDDGKYCLLCYKKGVVKSSTKIE